MRYLNVFIDLYIIEYPARIYRYYSRVSIEEVVATAIVRMVSLLFHAEIHH